MHTTHVAGIDPGLVHTGVVQALFDPVNQCVSIYHSVVLGPNAEQVHQVPFLLAADHIFIEGYRSRSNFHGDKQMLLAVDKIKSALPKGRVLDNMGIKKVVKRPLLELLQLWKFDTPTHHDDLRSAARIMLLGMLKDEKMNSLLADFVRDNVLNGRHWDVQH
jgi:hypothetical protein